MNEDVKKRVDKLVRDLRALFGERLMSVCVYGSAVFEDLPVESREPYKNINVLVILDKLNHKDLERATPLGQWWDSVAHTLPMFLSEEEWCRSHDVYAMEAADIRDNHYVAYGKDLFSNVAVDKAALRLICELELHRKLVFLRQRLLIRRDDPKALTGFLFNSINSFAALFRAVLRLTHAAVPQQSQQVFETVKNRVESYDSAPFLRILSLRELDEKIPPAEVLPLFEAYVMQIGHVVEYVDQKFETIVEKEGVL